MTDRERLATRGGSAYRMIGDNQQCAKEYGELWSRGIRQTWPGHNQRAGLSVEIARHARSGLMSCARRS